MSLKNLSSLSIGLVICALCGPLQANETGVKAMGMGGALIALPQEVVAIAYNPATATELGRRFDVGIIGQGWIKSLDVSNREPGFAEFGEGTYKADGNPGVFVDGGIVGDGLCRTSIGIAVYNQEFISTHYDRPLNDFGGVNQGGEPVGSNVSFDYRMDTVSFVLAYPLNCCHSIGLGINLNVASFRVSGLENLRNYSVRPDFVTNNGTAWSSGGGVTLGWLGQLCPGFKVGVSYISSSTLSGMHRYEGLLPLHHRIELPTIWEIGISYDYGCGITLAADVEYRHYRHPATWRNPFPLPSREPLEPVFGSADGPGFDWTNQVKLRLGGQWQCHPDWVVRAGYRYENTPIHGHGSETALNVLTLNTVQNYFTLGATWNINLCSELSFFAEYGLEQGVPSAYPQIFEGFSWSSANLLMRSQSYAAGLAYGMAF